MMLYEQGILNYDADVYNKLADGTMTAYDFMYSKIEDLEITPGQLGLEPSTGSVVVTDTEEPDSFLPVYPTRDMIITGLQIPWIQAIIQSF